MHTHTHTQSELESQRNDGLVSIRQSISSARSALSLTNFPIDKDKYLMYNSRVQPEARESDELSLTDLASKPRCVIGTEVCLFVRVLTWHRRCGCERVATRTVNPLIQPQCGSLHTSYPEIRPMCVNITMGIAGDLQT